MRYGGGSSKYQSLWLESTLSRFDSEKLRNPPLLIRVPRSCVLAINITACFNRDGGIDPPKSFCRRGLQPNDNEFMNTDKIYKKCE